MRGSLETSLQLVFGAEGGYTVDEGGPTKYGITAKTLAAARGVPSVRAEDVQALTLEDATAIYQRSYWSQSGGDVLPAGLDYAAFDFGVNSGPNRAVRTLQTVLGVKPDGWIGEKTLKAVGDRDIAELIQSYCDARMSYLQRLSNWPKNKRGWTIRVTGKDPKHQWPDRPGVVGNALKMAADVQTEDHGPLPEGGTAKAEPKATTPWLDPAVLLPGIGAAMGGAGTLVSGTGPVQIALALGIVVSIGVGALFAVRYLKGHPA